ncbi:MAG TPA: ATP-binding protein, partial [Bdellovibrionales bacterium]|nr:ATP-binding protein [Bdellovibrionales bacterium]
VSNGSCLILSLSGADDDAVKAIPAHATGLLSNTGEIEKMSQRFLRLQRSRSLESGAVVISNADEHNGSFALVRVKIDSQTSYGVALFQPESDGGFTDAQISSLRAMTQLLSGKITAPTFEASPIARVEALESELRDLRDFYRHFSDSIKQCFWVIDTTTQRVLTVSENFERVWGASRSILTTGGLTGFMGSVSPDDRDRVLAEFHNGFGKEIDLELRVIDQTGELRWIWLRGCPMRMEGDAETASRLVLIADDISDKKSQEEQVRTREAELISRARALAVVDLASGVAHEINNPLTVIVGKASELKQHARSGNTDAANTIAIADKIQTTSIRISDIIKSLKTLARQERADIFTAIPISIIMNDVRDMCTERLKAAGIELRMPDRAFEAGISAEMNATLVSQLILNLVNNAFDAVKNLDSKWIQVEIADAGDSVFFYVTDSGPGIPIKIRGRIFDPFFTTKGPGGGTGLGLSLSTSIAAHHHGTLRLDTLHTHTRFVAQIPKKHPRRTG